MRYSTMMISSAWLVVLVLAVSADDCWHSVSGSQEEDCFIHATINKPLNNTSDGSIGSHAMAMKIDCHDLGSQSATVGVASEIVPVPKDAYLEHLFRHAQNLSLDGCHTPITMASYGLEHLPNCRKFQKITIERFHSDEVQPMNCFDHGEGPMETSVLIFRHNEIARIEANSLANFLLLRELYFESNSLRHLDARAFDALPIIEVIHMEAESSLAIKDPDFLYRTSVIDVRLVGLKLVPSDLNLSDTLKYLRIADTPIVGRMVNISNPQSLLSIELVNCSLSSFVLFDAYMTVTEVKLRGNEISTFIIDAPTAMSGIRSLDLSENQLESLPLEWLRPMHALTELILRGNVLKVLSLKQLLTVLPSAIFIDLSDNRLRSLRDTDAEFDCDLTRIQIDRNPWNCQWLLDFAHTYPEKFRIFQYNKFISRINVNGLECVAEQFVAPVSNEADVGNNQSLGEKPEDDIFANISMYTLIYGSPWEIKRNQRTASLIIVFMLPVGIALLFLLLYLWIHCQKIFHLSYYRDRLEQHHLHHMHHHNHATTTMGERFDVVRQMPAQLTGEAPNGSANQGYEIPLNGLSSACNCTNLPYQTLEATNTPEKCRKTLHVTYESPPTDQPHALYEEILEEDTDADKNSDPLHFTEQPQPLYDQLIYRDVAHTP